MYQPGDPVIYRMSKFSRQPGPRARNVIPAAHGDDYHYLVDKFWIVAEVRDDETLLLRTRRGKEHVVRYDDPHLRHASWWERLLYRHRFPRLSEK